MASFTALPVEIRREIYSYLLLTHNAHVEEPVECSGTASDEGIVLIPSISTSLFTVNKKISAEALWYFYRENSFVAICSEMYNAFAYIRAVVPCFRFRPYSKVDRREIRKRQTCLRKVILIGTFKLRHPVSHRPDKAERDVHVCATRHLLVLIRLLNVSHLGCAVPGQSIEAKFNFKLGRTYYTENKRVVEVLIKTLEALTVPWLESAETFMTCRLHGKIGVIGKNRFESQVSVFSLDILFDYCRWALKSGCQASNKRSFALAEMYFNIVTWLLGKYNEAGMEPDQLDLWEIAHVQTLSRHTENYTKANKYRLACRSAAGAVHAYLEGVHKHTDHKPLVYLFYTAGCAFAGRAQFANTARNLCGALWLLYRALVLTGRATNWPLPDTSEVRDIYHKIREIKANLARLEIKDPEQLPLDEIIVHDYDERTDFPFWGEEDEESEQ